MDVGDEPLNEGRGRHLKEAIIIGGVRILRKKLFMKKEENKISYFKLTLFIIIISTIGFLCLVFWSFSRLGIAGDRTWWIIAILDFILLGIIPAIIAVGFLWLVNERFKWVLFKENSK